MPEIVVSYRSIDRHSERRRFKTLAGAQRYAQKWIGQHPEICSSYAIAGDGIGRITCEGCTLQELFPAPVGPQYAVFPDTVVDRHGGVQRAWYAQRDDGAAFGPFGSKAEGEAEVARLKREEG